MTNLSTEHLTIDENAADADQFADLPAELRTRQIEI